VDRRRPRRRRRPARAWLVCRRAGARPGRGHPRLDPHWSSGPIGARSTTSRWSNGRCSAVRACRCCANGCSSQRHDY